MLPVDPQFKWLLWEGVVPMFGAGLLFVVWGLVLAVVRGAWSSTFAWKECIDSMGWLYAALVIAIQASIRGSALAKGQDDLVIWCYVGATVCFMMLLAAMHERAHSSSWQPPTSMKISATMLVFAILFAGYKAQAVPQQGQPNLATATPEAVNKDGGKK